MNSENVNRLGSSMAQSSTCAGQIERHDLQRETAAMSLASGSGSSDDQLCLKQFHSTPAVNAGNRENCTIIKWGESQNYYGKDYRVAKEKPSDALAPEGRIKY
jgi:hypothetical protein